jgi:hypothetical protein
MTKFLVKLICVRSIFLMMILFITIPYVYFIVQ